MKSGSQRSVCAGSFISIYDPACGKCVTGKRRVAEADVALAGMTKSNE